MSTDQPATTLQADTDPGEYAAASTPKPATGPELAREPMEEPIRPAPAVSGHAATLMARLALGLLIAVVLINIPFNAQGQALARSVPSSASLVIMDGLLVQESNSPDVYVYRGDAFHWITSLDAFQHYGYQWQNVHSVEPGFLKEYSKGGPIYVLAKCDASPHVYRLEGGTKRWIIDLATFTAQGYIWEDVEVVPCTELHNLPNGDSIPPGHGTPPPPLP